jgi:N-acylneuraminate cytidylyltransferase/CMP-N,N'-diacetyllegionaminic acid synthase
VLGKNIRSLAGKPLISYSIEAALNSKLDRVIVSTEDEKIASIAGDFGAEVPFQRPRELATDEASSLSVLLHALRHLEEKEKFSPDIIALLQPTSPFRTSKHIDAGLNILQKSAVDSVIGVCEVDPGFHPYYTYRKDEDDNLEEFIEVKEKPLRSQDLPKLYKLNDALFISQRGYFDTVGEHSPCFNPKSMKGLVMDRISSLSIDDEFDFLFAEFVVKSGWFKGAKL